MTSTLSSALQEAAVQTQISTLPLRQDDPVSWIFLIKVLLITAILLLITYAGLRWYAHRQRQSPQIGARPELQCTSALRLSSRTKIYLVRSNKSEVLITESSTGTSAIVLPGALPTPASDTLKP